MDDLKQTPNVKLSRFMQNLFIRFRYEFAHSLQLVTFSKKKNDKKNTRNLIMSHRFLVSTFISRLSLTTEVRYDLIFL